ncbi:MAG TPA: pirin family protein, partial [Rhizomicrobium sp.]|nr:pirin family protein [Rhizomicrobium sp.]
IRPGEIQRMSAGSGIVHAEFNASATQTCHLLQIWIMPSQRGIAPGYEQKAIDPQSVHNHFARIAAPDPRENEVRLVQDAEIWAAKLDAGVEAIHPLAQGRKAWLQVAKGEVRLGEDVLQAGDAAAISDLTEIAVKSNAPSEVLLFDLA